VKGLISILNEFYQVQAANEKKDFIVGVRCCQTSVTVLIMLCFCCYQLV